MVFQNTMSFNVGLLAAVVVIILIFLWLKPKSEPSLYERLGGIYPIAAVVDRFSDKLIDNPIVGKNSANPYLSEWHTSKLDRLPGLKFMRTLWLSTLAGAPFKYSASSNKSKCPFASSSHNLKNPHSQLHISSEEFDEVANVLAETIDEFKIPAKEKGEILSVFAAHKGEVVSM